MTQVHRYEKNGHDANRERGFSMIEILIVLLVAMVLTGMALPAAHSAISDYQLSAAVQSAAGAVQGARYQAIMHGYPYQVDINGTTNEYQVSSEPGGSAAFSAVGSAVPLSGSSIAINVGAANQNSPGQVIMQFSPNGSVSVISGQAMPVSFTISYGGTTKTLTVSNYGSITEQ